MTCSSGALSREGRSQVHLSKPSALHLKIRPQHRGRLPGMLAGGVENHPSPPARGCQGTCSRCSSFPETGALPRRSPCEHGSGSPWHSDTRCRGRPSGSSLGSRQQASSLLSSRPSILGWLSPACRSSIRKGLWPFRRVWRAVPAPHCRSRPCSSTPKESRPPGSTTPWASAPAAPPRAALRSRLLASHKACVFTCCGTQTSRQRPEGPRKGAVIRKPGLQRRRCSAVIIQIPASVRPLPGRA